MTCAQIFLALSKRERVQYLLPFVSAKNRNDAEGRTIK